VQALVVVWGRAQDDLHGRKVGGIEFVSGRKLRGWLRQHQAAANDQATAARLLNDVRAYRRLSNRPTTPASSTLIKPSASTGRP